MNKFDHQAREIILLRGFSNKTLSPVFLMCPSICKSFYCSFSAKMKQKPMEKNPEPLPFIIVAAMVIGPTTSYAFSFITSQEDIKMPKMEYAGNYMYRVPTSVLTDENDTFLEFGGAAEER